LENLLVEAERLVGIDGRLPMIGLRTRAAVLLALGVDALEVLVHPGVEVGPLLEVDVLGLVDPELGELEEEFALLRPRVEPRDDPLEVLDRLVALAIGLLGPLVLLELHLGGHHAGSARVLPLFLPPRAPGSAEGAQPESDGQHSIPRSHRNPPSLLGASRPGPKGPGDDSDHSSSLCTQPVLRVNW